MSMIDATNNSVLNLDFDALSTLEVHDIAQTTTNQKTKVLRNYEPTTTQIDALATYGTKANAIRSLHKEGKSISVIADILNIRYQHVFNTVNQQLKKGPK